ncbi:DUF1253-domain-containing protein [Sistotremastrum suecicum HHB10207 ss-3]|uniref:U3 small nucleolar RNA-associated protein 25 n=1 Tax=Sistotremastrum suecicum HHB10207 ss-3 TaxID=1314776 RepID=A0A166I6Q1_9AGAM|nr:DUF1253-domain-containing protein [Sistotremastrum suecicum HHB10207 ss-3]
MNSNTVRLLTVLNVVHSKRAISEVDTTTSIKSIKKKKLQTTETTVSQTVVTSLRQEEKVSQDTAPAVASEMDVEVSEDDDQHELHFGATSEFLSSVPNESLQSLEWTQHASTSTLLGGMTELVPTSAPKNVKTTSPVLISRLKGPHEAKKSALPEAQRKIQDEFFALLSSYQDIFFSRTELHILSDLRDAATLHVLNHVMKIRRRILKNNEKVAHEKDVGSQSDIRDQGFTRPSILILLPFRNSALRWLNSLISHMPGMQVENHSRFTSEFSLPSDAIDKLTSAAPGVYPEDHVETFGGNIDDDFRIGLKLTRKSIKIFSEFFKSDIIIASPFGLRRVIEQEKNGDFLSSIEVLVIDQLDVLTMQNWDHLEYVLSHVNRLPEESHDTDFSRIKPWYLDGHASYLRQSILLSPYETPEMKALFNRQFSNVAGKLRLRKSWPPVKVPEGVQQNFVKFESSNPQTEPDQRFEYFTTQLLPSVFKSAVQSANTVIFVPSYFDFVRVRRYLKELPEMSLAVLFEESSNQDISRARQAFFSGNKSFLLTTERFHFFRRYKLRGIRNIIFYALPEHPQFYTEFLSFPFLDEGVDAADVTCRALFSKYDALRLERIVGTEAVLNLINSP